MILTETISSHYRKDHVYGNKGDRVSVVKMFGTVAVVEDKNGRRFSVPANKLSDQPVEADKLDPIVKDKPIINQVQKRSIKNGPPAPQNTLF